MIYVWIGIGGAAGAILRTVISGRIDMATGLGFPYGTMLVNLSGCLVMGIITAVFVRYTYLSNDVKSFLAAGMLGGYTTFSRFSMEAFLLLEKGEFKQAAAYILVSALGSLIFFAAGFYSIRQLLRLFGAETNI